MEAQTKKQQKRMFGKAASWKDADLYLMLAPMLVLIFLFSYKPLSGLVIAFKDYSPYKGVWESEWVGLEYFREFFNSPFAWRTIRNTVTISLSMLLFSFPAPILFALLLNEVRREKFKKLGLLSLDSITAFLDEQAERERFLKEVLEAAGMLREVNSYDRSNYRLWSLEWGLPDEVILAAARRSKGLSPVRTMHRLLSACKAQNIRTAAGVEALSPEPAPPKKREEGVGHTYSKDELTAIFDDIQKSELF